MIVRDGGRGVYSLCRLDLARHLFHPSTAAAQAAASAKANEKKGLLLPTTSSCGDHLPRPSIKFSMTPAMAGSPYMHFFSLLRGQAEAEGSVMFVPCYDNPVMYDVDKESVAGVPLPSFPKHSDSISMSVAGPRGRVNRRYDDGGGQQQLYVITRGNGYDGFFEPLPSPPLYSPDIGRKVFSPSAAAVVDDTTICVSSVDAGSSCAFDTARGEWRQAGRWVLPCDGAAEYVPELGVWFGVEHAKRNPDHFLRAFDLSSSSPPVVRQTWSYLDRLPGEWLTSQRHLVNLGAGKFIATSFQSIERHPSSWGYRSDDGLDDDVVLHDLTVLTGVEVVRRGDELHMINHKRKIYRFQDDSIIHCVL
ncbi:hypothetical protein VPH35_081362 [Triticum aestivum]